MERWSHYTEHNRRAWDEIAQVRSTHYRQTADYPASFFAAGGSSLDRRVVEVTGDVNGTRLLHLMCGTGEETLSWAVLGADAVGVDISDTQITLARAKAEAAGVAVRFVTADVGRLPADLAAGCFDWVYTATGVLVWIPDLNRWAKAVVSALAPGGRLVLWEEHPVAMCLWGVEGQIRIMESYFERGAVSESRGWKHFAGGEHASEPKYEFSWTLGDVITAVADAGMRIEQLIEYPSDAEWRFGAALPQARHLPGQFLLVARHV